MDAARATARRSLGAEFKWQLSRAVTAVGPGSVVGLVVGGMGCRLAMLVLRLTSPDFVTGVKSDDGFEIGRFSFDALNLLLFGAVLGGLSGAT